MTSAQQMLYKDGLIAPMVLPTKTCSSRSGGGGVAPMFKPRLRLEQGLHLVLNPVELRHNGSSVQQAGRTPSAPKVKICTMKRCHAMGGNPIHAFHDPLGV